MKKLHQVCKKKSISSDVPEVMKRGLQMNEINNPKNPSNGSHQKTCLQMLGLLVALSIFTLGETKALGQAKPALKNVKADTIKSSQTSGGNISIGTVKYDAQGKGDWDVTTKYKVRFDIEGGPPDPNVTITVVNCTLVSDQFYSANNQNTGNGKRAKPGKGYWCQIEFKKADGGQPNKDDGKDWSVVIKLETSISGNKETAEDTSLKGKVNLEKVGGGSSCKSTVKCPKCSTDNNCNQKDKHSGAHTMGTCINVTCGGVPPPPPPPNGPRPINYPWRVRQILASGGGNSPSAQNQNANSRTLRSTLRRGRSRR